MSAADGSDAGRRDHAPADLRAAIEAAAPPTLPLTFKSMFGGIMAYADGQPLASLSNVGLALKLSPADREALLRQPGARLLQYAPDAPVSKQYVVLPEIMLTDEAALADWLERGARHVATLKKPSRRK